MQFEYFEGCSDPYCGMNGILCDYCYTQATRNKRKWEELEDEN